MSPCAYLPYRLHLRGSCSVQPPAQMLDIPGVQMDVGPIVDYRTVVAVAIC